MIKLTNNTKCLCCMFCIVVIIAFLGYAVYYLQNRKSKESFNEGGNVKTLIFFKANWCGHCNRFKPVWDEFVTECENKNEPTKLVELDIDNDESKPLMEKHNVRGFPHVVLTSDNDEDVVFTKNRTKEDLIAFLKEHA
jgi:protein disulfide-isomerase